MATYAPAPTAEQRAQMAPIFAGLTYKELAHSSSLVPGRRLRIMIEKVTTFKNLVIIEGQGEKFYLRCKTFSKLIITGKATCDAHTFEIL